MTGAVAGSGPAEDIELIAEIVIPGALARTSAKAVDGADLVVVAVPLHKHRSIDPAILEGHIVIDAVHYWHEVAVAAGHRRTGTPSSPKRTGPQEHLLESIHLLATEVKPRVERFLARS